MEIERKFLVDRLPEEAAVCPGTPIQQAYLCREPVIRVRRMGERRMLTCKGTGLLAREEFEQELTETAYDRLLAKAEGGRLSKIRRRVPYGAHTIEVDVFDPPLAPLVLADVEFPTEAEALAFQPPAWFGREVTYDPAYTNASLSEHLPPPEAASVRPGRYRHFKGREYEVLYTATHSETREPMVVYRALYGEYGLWVRPASMWNELVTRDGVTQPRFTYIGETD